MKVVKTKKIFTSLKNVKDMKWNEFTSFHYVDCS